MVEIEREKIMAILKPKLYVRIFSCLACYMESWMPGTEFEEHERSVRVIPRGVGESNSSLLSVLQTSQAHP